MKRLNPFINLSHVVQMVKNGYYKSEEELLEEFRTIERSVEEFKGKALDAYDEQLSCEHTYGEPWYYLKVDLFNRPYYSYHKKCTQCGKEIYVEVRDGSGVPDGYEGATENYWNNNI